MTKNKKLFWVDIALLILFAATILSISTDIFQHSFIHVIFGMILSSGSLFHIILHWSWIKKALKRFNHLPDQARSNAMINLVLFCGFVICGIFGLTARALVINHHLHIFLGWFHSILAILVITLLVIHITRHWKWLSATTRRMVIQ